MKNILATTAALLAMAVPAPALATTFEKVNHLIDLVEETGTDVVYTNCAKHFNKPNVYGFYVLDKEAKVDHLVICEDYVDARDPVAVWEVLAHEATHVMHACHNGYIIKDEAIKGIIANLKDEDVETILGYPDEKMRREVEAFHMEDEDPEVVIELFKRFCFQ